MLASCYEQYTAVTGREVASSLSSKKKNKNWHDSSSRAKGVASKLDNSSSTNVLERQDSLHHASNNTGRSFDTANSTTRHSSPRRQRRVAVAVLDTLRDPQGRQVVITPSRARRQRLFSSNDVMSNARSFESDNKQDIPVSISWAP
jgi:hypothetical protein